MEIWQAKRGAERMSKSKTALGLAVAVCAFGVVATPALAFGKFHAEIPGRTISESEPGTAKASEGEVEFLKVGPYRMEGCTGLGAKSKVIAEESESFYLELKFRGCEAVSKPKGSNIEEIKKVSFNLGMEVLSNYSAKVGEGESEARIVEPSSVSFKAHQSKCVVVIPSQSLPLKQKEGVEYEAAVPETEEGVRHAGPFRYLNFEINLRKLRSYITPNDKCRYKEESEEGKFNPETGNVEFNGGIFEGFLGEVKLNEGGSLWFEA
jgi:hypothetical protein